jgi:putative ABC transport system permease protein
MFLLALKSELAKKLRLFSTALSVLLGVAFLTGTLVFTDTIRRTFDDLFADVYEHTDSYVRSSRTLDLGFGQEQRGRIPDDLLMTVTGVEGVAEAQGVVSSFAQIVTPDGDAIGDPGNGPPTFAMSYVGGELSPWALTPGSRAPGPGEIAVDQASADKGDLVIGDTVTLLTQTGPHELVLVGTVKFGSVDSPGGASVSLLDLATSQQLLLDGASELDAIMIAADPGVDETTLTQRVAAVLPDGAEALTGTQITEDTQQTMRDAMSFFGTALLVFAGIGLVVACFTIYNTFQIVVTQRTREMALLRSVGATRPQVLWAQLLEALLVGITASAAGLAAGVLVARLLNAMMEAFGIDIPGGGSVFMPRTAVVAMTVGVVVTVVAAVFPSLRASRVPPLAAVRDVAVDVSSQSRRRLVSGGVVTVLGVAAYVMGLAGNGVAWVGLGALATFVGVFMLGPLIARPAVALLGAPVEATSGITGSLARQNAMRNPKRTSRTGGALMVGVALVAAITVLAASVRDWTRDSFDSLFTGDYVVSTSVLGFGGISPDAATELGRLPEVAAASGVRFGAAHDVAADADVTYVAVDPTTAGQVFDLDMETGSMDALTPDGILLSVAEADGRGAEVGDRLAFAFLDGTTRTLTVEGTYHDDDPAGAFVVSHALHESTDMDQFDSAVYIAAAPGVDDTEVEAAIERVAGAYANADVQSREEFIDAQAAQYDQLVNLMYGLLALAVIIALVNIANSLALSIHERTHELGLLRAVGTTRRQTSTSVVWEAVLVGVLGTLIGLLLGTFFGWSISVEGRGLSLDAFVVPVVPLTVIGVVAVLGAVVAALRPAWRAAHLDVLRAIATE